MMKSVVMKFGGSVLRHPESFRDVAEFIKEKMKVYRIVAVVVSAIQNETDRLLETIKLFCMHETPRELASIISIGEQQSASLLAIALNNIGVYAKSLNAWQAGILTDSKYHRADVLELNTSTVNELALQTCIPVIVGFQGINNDNEVTTLGRNGSDITAMLFANMLAVDECHIYGNVDGVYKIDPAIFPQANKYAYISRRDLYRLVKGGASVLADKALDYYGDSSSFKLFIGAINAKSGTFIEHCDICCGSDALVGINVVEELALAKLDQDFYDMAFKFVCDFNNNKWYKGKAVYLLETIDKDILFLAKNNFFGEFLESNDIFFAGSSRLGDNVVLLNMVFNNQSKAIDFSSNLRASNIYRVVSYCSLDDHCVYLILKKQHLTSIINYIRKKFDLFDKTAQEILPLAVAG